MDQEGGIFEIHRPQITANLREILFLQSYIGIRNILPGSVLQRNTVRGLRLYCHLYSQGFKYAHQDF